MVLLRLESSISSPIYEYAPLNPIKHAKNQTFVFLSAVIIERNQYKVFKFPFLISRSHQIACSCFIKFVFFIMKKERLSREKKTWNLINWLNYFDVAEEKKIIFKLFSFHFFNQSYKIQFFIFLLMFFYSFMKLMTIQSAKNF